MSIFQPRHHFGINKSTASTLPEKIISAIEKALGDFPLKSIVEEGEVLNRYIKCRKAAAEDQNIRSKVREIEDQMDVEPEKFKLPKVSPDPNDKETFKIYKEKRSQKVQHIMKQRIYAWKPITYDPYKSLLYLLGRSAQEYAVLMKIFREIQKRDPEFKPRSYFDFGAGVGSGCWAASDLWKSSIYEYYLVDASKDMNDLSDLILRDGDPNKTMNLRNVYHRQFLPARNERYDIVLSAYSLFELPTLKNRLEVVHNLWNKAANYLIFVEYGSNAGFKLLNEVREFLTELKEQDSYVFAPCSHDLQCPRFQLNDETPCNFEISFNSLPFGGNSHIKKEPYSYLVIKKGSQPPAERWPRIVRPTLVKSKHSICRMCTNEGKLKEIIFTASKHGKMAYRCARHSRWGDQLPINIEEEIKLIEDDEAIKTIVDEEIK